MIQRVWKNDEDLILFGADGQIIRQPFEFGGGFSQGVNTSIRLVFEGLQNIDKNYHTVIMWTATAVAGSFGFAAYPNATFNNRLYSGTFSNGSRSFLPDEGVVINRIGSTDNRALLAGIKNNGTNSIYTNKSLVISPKMSVGVNDFTSLVLGYSGQSNYLQSAIVGEVMIFNRPMLKEGLDFIYSNGNGSTPQTDDGLVFYAPVKVAEILDFSALQDGSDLRVGCREELTGKHGYFTSLPAGSLAEKLTFANTNLFKLFL